MAELSPCPIEFEAEVLISGSLEISSEKLARGLSWLASSLKEQNRVLGTLCKQMDAIQENATLPSAGSQEGRTSMKDEMLSMQLNALKHEVGALPRPADLERQRERLMAEVQTVSSTLSDRQRDSSERLQKDLAEATESLCSQLGRIDTSVSARLLELESRFTSRPARASTASTQPIVDLPDTGVQMLPVLDPLSTSGAVAEDTEDNPDGTIGSDLAAAQNVQNLGNLAAELAALDSRMSTWIDTMERQVSELASKLDTVQSAPALQTPHRASGTTDGKIGTSESADSDPSHASHSGRPDDSNQLAASEGEPLQKTSDFAEAVEAAVAAAREAASSAVTEVAEEAKAAACRAAAEMFEAKEKDRETMTEAMAAQISTLQQAVTMLTNNPNHPQTDASKDQKKSILQETQELPELPKSDAKVLSGTEAQTLLAPDNIATSDRVSKVEASLAKIAGMLPAVEELQGSFLRLEAVVSTLQQATLECHGPTQAPTSNLSGEAGTATTSDTRDSVGHTAAQNDEVPTTQTAQTPAIGGDKQRSSVDDSKKLAQPIPEEGSLLKLEERLKDLEDLQESAEQRLRRLESPEVQRKQSTENILKEGWRSSKSEPPSGGTVGGSWKDVQAELEHFRKLFEFIEGVLPRDAAEAMRFFSRRQLGKEVMSEMVSEIFGADVEFQNAKLQLQSDFRMHTRDLRREFDKLTVALKALQRDREGSDGRLSDLAKRTSNLETEVRTGKPLAEDTLVASTEAGCAPQQDQVETAHGRGHDEMRKAIQDLREEVKHWLEAFKSSVVQALQTKPDNEQVLEFVKQVVAVPSGESVALFAKRQLLGKCASCEAPIDVDLMRVKRPQPIGLQEPWPPGESLGAKVAIRPLNAPLSPSCSSLSRLPKINEPRTRELVKKGMKPSSSTPELRKEQESPET